MSMSVYMRQCSSMRLLQPRYQPRCGAHRPVVCSCCALVERRCHRCRCCQLWYPRQRCLRVRQVQRVDPRTQRYRCCCCPCVLNALTRSRRELRLIPSGSMIFLVFSFLIGKQTPCTATSLVSPRRRIFPPFIRKPSRGRLPRVFVFVLVDDVVFLLLCSCVVAPLTYLTPSCH